MRALFQDSNPCKVTIKVNLRQAPIPKKISGARESKRQVRLHLPLRLVRIRVKPRCKVHMSRQDGKNKAQDVLRNSDSP